MAPNTISENSGGFAVEAEHGKHRKEILYNGYFYDITDFMDRHPGGNVIKFYTEPGEDATHAIQQFHHRSMSKVESILKSFKKRPAPLHERGMTAEALSRHEALNADFKKLFEDLQDGGYFEPSIAHVILRVLDAVALVIFANVVFFHCDTVITKFVAAILVGFAGSRHGWVMHEGGHKSLTGRPKIDRLLQDVHLCLFLLGSSSWWNSQHNRHHAMPQRLQHDVDLATLPFVAFHKRVVKDKSKINSFFVRYQAILYWTLDLFVANIAWKFLLHPRYQYRKKAYRELLLELPHIFYAIFLVGPGWYFLISYWVFFFLGINFALSHSHLEVADRPTHWVEYSLTHTANVKSSLIVDYFMGYLNFQIKHHLFPTMPQFRQKEISHRVKALAEKHGLPYRVYSYSEACVLALKNLNDVGKELTSKEYLGGKEILKHA